MERVLFDVEPAWELTARLQATELELGERRGQVRSLLTDADEGSDDVGRLLGAARDWCSVVADDLRWRLEFLASLPSTLVSDAQARSGVVDGLLPVTSREEATQWRRGASLHGQLLDALDAGDGARADELLDQLRALTSTPIGLAGFVASLGTTGLADLHDRIDAAKAADPRNTFAEWIGGSNPRWDTMNEELAAFAGSTGALAAYGADDLVEVRLAGGDVQVVTMRDLLLRSPHEVAGAWVNGVPGYAQTFVEFGGELATIVPTGPNVTGSGMLVPRLEGVPGSGMWFEDGSGLQTTTYEMPGFGGLAWQTVKHMRAHPGQALQTAWDNPDQAVAGFFMGASVALAGGYVVAAAGSAGLLGVGAAAGAETSLAAVFSVNSGLTAANFARTVLDDEPCKVERLALGGGMYVLGGGVVGSLRAGGMEALAAGGSTVGNVVPVPVRCADERG